MNNHNLGLIAAAAAQPSAEARLAAQLASLLGNSNHAVPPVAAAAQQPRPPPPNLEQLRTRVRAHVDEAIRGIPMERKKAYLKALETAPELIKTESDPLAYVRRCSYDVWAAAERLCLYWEERAKLFGDKAFLPLLLTGDGALSKQDILCLHAGFPAMLPDTRTGQKVVLCDRRKYIASANGGNRLRAIFYVHKTYLQDERTQVEGIQCFVLLITPRFGDIDRPFVKRAMHLTSHVFATKTNLHFLSFLPQPKAGKGQLAESIMSAVMAMLIQCGLSDAQMHIERERGEILEKLGQIGLEPEGIPLCLGGSWKFEEFFKWCQATETKEREENSGFLQSLPLVTGSDTVDNEQIRSEVPQSAEEKLSKKRLADVIHSRRKRERKRQELINLQEDSKMRKEENKRLLAENSKLKDMLADAEAIVASLPASKEAQPTASVSPAVATSAHAAASPSAEDQAVSAMAGHESALAYSLHSSRRRASRKPALNHAVGICDDRKQQACGESSDENSNGKTCPEQQLERQLHLLSQATHPPISQQHQQFISPGSALALQLQQNLQQTQTQIPPAVHASLLQRQQHQQLQQLFPAVPRAPSLGDPGAGGPGFGDIASTILRYSPQQQAELFQLILQMNAREGGR